MVRSVGPRQGGRRDAQQAAGGEQRHKGLHEAAAEAAGRRAPREQRHRAHHGAIGHGIAGQQADAQVPLGLQRCQRHGQGAEALQQATRERHGHEAKAKGLAQAAQEQRRQRAGAAEILRAALRAVGAQAGQEPKACTKLLLDAFSPS